MMTTVGGTLTSRMEISVGIRIKEEMLVSEERMEHSEDPHQLCWTKLHPTTQLQRQSVSDSHQCVLGLWLHTHCLQQVLNQVWQDVGHGWIDLQVTECYPAQVFTISCDSSHQQRKVLLVRLMNSTNNRTQILTLSHLWFS
jgi:hypothetical protein